MRVWPYLLHLLLRVSTLTIPLVQFGGEPDVLQFLEVTSAMQFKRLNLKWGYNDNYAESKDVVSSIRRALPLQLLQLKYIEICWGYIRNGFIGSCMEAVEELHETLRTRWTNVPESQKGVFVRSDRGFAHRWSRSLALCFTIKLDFLDGGVPVLIVLRSDYGADLMKPGAARPLESPEF